MDRLDMKLLGRNGTAGQGMIPKGSLNLVAYR